MEQKTQIEAFTWIEKLLPELGLSHFGMTELKTPLSFEYYRTWLEQGLHGKMNYLLEHAPMKASPQDTFSPAQSAFIFAAPYFPHPEPTSPFSQARVAMYAKGFDYHYWLKQKLQRIVDQLQQRYPKETFLIMTDSAPLLERDLAHQASLGWFGKNTCLIHPKKGSLFLLAEILTSLKITQSLAPLPDFCGTCQKCIEICPTQALIAPHKLDANKCISYWTIESRTVAPVEIREKIGDWFFGCDLCQTVCPWNQKLFKNQLSIEPSLTLNYDETRELQNELKWILETSGKQIQKKIIGTPLMRAGPRGLKRNALIVIGNRQLTSLKPQVEVFLSHLELGELAQWTLSKLAHA